jgi:hypothetical protein
LASRFGLIRTCRGGQNLGHVDATSVPFWRASLAALSSREPGELQVSPHLRLTLARRCDATAWHLFFAPLSCLLVSRLSKRIATEMATCLRCLLSFMSSQAGYRLCKPMHRLWSVFQNPAGLKRALGSYSLIHLPAVWSEIPHRTSIGHEVSRREQSRSSGALRLLLRIPVNVSQFHY